jgi:Zn-dependent protease with chaperone function
MVETRHISIGISGYWIILALLAFTLGYFQYGKDFNAGFGMILLSLALAFLSFVGIVPFVGFLIYYFLATLWLMPQVLTFVGLTSSWVTQLFLWLNFIGAIIFTVLTSIIVCWEWID